MKKVILKLKDGREFQGTSFGDESALGIGEVVFNTGIPGYEEILTDPSYKGQIVVLTSPMIGNYGISPMDKESDTVKAAALVVKKLYRGPLLDGREGLESYMKREGVMGVEGIDTRALTLHLRDNGSKNGIIFPPERRSEAEELLSSYPEITEIDLIGEVAVKKRIDDPEYEGIQKPLSPRFRFALVDYGVKRSIIASLYRRGVAVTLFPPDVKSEEILSGGFDALFLSNGPGDPAILKDTIVMAKECIGRIPLRGICLGHQILTHALGGRTMKMKFGHHGSNHPVKDLDTGKTMVTAQNHGFMSDESTLTEGVEVWLRNCNDGTVEGIRCPEKNVVCVQFHPEAAPGPEEGSYVFDRFLEDIR